MRAPLLRLTAGNRWIHVRRQAVLAASPRVKLQHPELDETHEAREVIGSDVEVGGRVGFARLRDLDAPQGVGHALGEVFLVKAVLLPTLRAAHQRERAALNVGEDP